MTANKTINEQRALYTVHEYSRKQLHMVHLSTKNS